MGYKGFVKSNNLEWIDGVSDVPFSELLGKTPIKVEKVDDENLYFEFEDCIYLMHHWGDCCEIVEIEDICGDLQDLVGTPILLQRKAQTVKITQKMKNGIFHSHGHSINWQLRKVMLIFVGMALLTGIIQKKLV